MNKKIVFKIFLFSFLFLMIFTIFFTALQTLGFESYFYKEKSLQLESNFSNLVKDLNTNSNKNLLNVVSSYITPYERSNDSTILFTNDSSPQSFNCVDGIIKGDPTNLGSEALFFKQQYALAIENNPNLIDTNNEMSHATFIGKYMNITYSFYVSHFINGLNRYTIYSFTSLKPISDSTSFFTTFSIYMFIVSFIISIVLGFVFSRIVSKPLIKLDQGATALSNMDFSKPIMLSTGDEFENVANSLNLLAKKLDVSLKELSLKNVRLKEDIDLKEKSEKLRREFVAGVSHELKTPLSIISSYSEALIDDIPNDNEKINYYNIILDEASKMNNLIFDMLNLAHLESGNYVLAMDKIDLIPFIKTIITKFKNKETKKNFNLNCSYENILVFADPIRIEQVFKNLFTNAIKHTDDSNNINTLISIEKNFCTISIFNQGDPIPKFELKNIWDRFYKLDKSRNREKKGTGLGLSITKSILLAHNSKFGVKNIDDGVCFFFTLPIYDSNK